MSELIKKLRARPETYRKGFSFFLSGVVTLFIFSAWILVNFGSDTGVLTEEAGLPVIPSEETQVAGPLHSIIDNLTTSWESFREVLQQSADNLDR